MSFYLSRPYQLSLRCALLALALLLVACNSSGGGGSALLTWEPPLERVNGETITKGEIAQYIIRYRHSSETQYSSVTTGHTGESTTIQEFRLDNVGDPDSYTIQVAAVDSDGIASGFVTAQRR